MTLNDPDMPDDPQEAAAYWFTREHGGLMTPQERCVFEAWRQADSRHEQAYREMMQVWGVAEATPEAAFEAILQRRPERASALVSRRRIVGLGAAGACGVAAAVVLMGPQRWLHAPVFSDQYRTRRGERRAFPLPDGSTLTLNTDTMVRVRFYESERLVWLEQGEAFFSVSPEPGRPFLVEAGPATVTVTGTAFSVLRDPDNQVAVAVESGSVEVMGGRWWHRQVRHLTAAQAVRVASTAATSEVFAINPGAVMAWRQGKVIFDGAPLEGIVAEMNRYRVQPVTVKTSSLRQLRVAGVFSTDDPDAFLAILPTLVPVTVLQLPDGRSEIVPR